MTTESTLRTILASEFDDYTIHRLVRVSDRNTVYDVTVEDRRAVCKMTHRQPALLAREGATLLTLQEQTTVPVPKVLGMGDGYLLQEWVAGDTYAVDAPPEERLALLPTVGQTLANLHNSTQAWFEGHGSFEPGTGPLTVDTPVDWPERLNAFVEEWADEVATTQYREVGSAVMSAVDTYRELFANCVPVLIHGEVSPDHVYFDDETTITLIDWEIAQAAPGEFDLIWAERDLLGRPVTENDSSKFKTALLEGYQEERSLGPAFWVRREVYRAAFALRELSVLVESETTAQNGNNERASRLQTYVYNRLDAVNSKATNLDR